MKKKIQNPYDYDCGSHMCENGCISLINYKEACSHPVKKLIAVADSQFYTDLKMIKHCLEIMKDFYKSEDVPEDFTFEHMLKGIENTIDKGYNLICTGVEKNGKK